ncbi:hypothetical protein [Brevundimonas sp.]|uniref:hypothetical protein n=1 Tax=Brevundimonas sp. TaxID=1871086 RepID=UPI0028A895FA|nr:hypothetical protein [Brevundimonas sp.]
MLIAAMTAALTLTAASADERSAQWVTHDVSGEGPVASFLNWNFTSVITRAHCADGRVAFQYFYDFPGSPGPGERVLAVTIDNTDYALTPSVDDMDRQVYTLSPEGQAALKQARNVDFHAPNEADEPWYLGRSAALTALARRCG